MSEENINNNINNEEEISNYNNENNENEIDNKSKICLVLFNTLKKYLK